MFGELIDKLCEIYQLYLNESFIVVKDSYQVLMAQLLAMINDEFKKIDIPVL